MNIHDKKNWLNGCGILSPHDVTTHSGSIMILWQSLQGNVTLAAEGKDLDDAIDKMFHIVKDKLYMLADLKSNYKA